MEKISIVIPTYQECESIIILLDQINNVLKNEDYEIIVVDDNSPDLTWCVVEEYTHRNPKVKLIRRIGERGLSSAIITGFNQAKGDFLIAMDADLSHPPSLLPKLISEIRRGNELVIASRRIEGGGSENWQWYRKVVSDIATYIAKITLGVKIKDPMSGYFALSRNFYEKVKRKLHPQGYKILLEIYEKGKPKSFLEIPFIFRNRKQGYSKLSYKTILQYLAMLYELKFRKVIDKIREKYHFERYKKVKIMLKPGNLIDLGCGKPCESLPDGIFLKYIKRGIGLDIRFCDGAINNFPFVQADICALPFREESFDNIVCMETIEHIDNVDLALQNIKRIMKKDGNFILSTPKNNLLWKLLWFFAQITFSKRLWSKRHKINYTYKDWKKKLKSYFKITKVKDHYFIISIFKLKKF